MYYIALIFIIIAGIAVISTISTINSNKKLRLKLEKTFGKTPTNYDINIDSILAYHQSMNVNFDNSNWIDDITWDDLDMDKVFKRINVCNTSVGEEYLYHILHTQYFNKDKLAKREKFISYLKSNPNMRLNLQMFLSKFGKSNYNGMNNLFNSNKLKQLKYPYLYTALAFIPLIGLVVFPFFQSLGIAILLMSFIINIAIYYLLKKKIDYNMVALEYFSSMLWCCDKICNIKDNQLKTFIVDLEYNFNVFKSLSSKISLTSKRNFSDIETFTEYLNILFLSNFRNYNKVVKSISKNITCFHKLYKCVGELDASICILSFRESLPFFCLPDFHNENSVSFDSIYHPLLSAPIANDAIIDNDCIITGSNASGKSTYIKTVAINGILAQTINTCLAHSYSTRFLLVITSMAVRDNLSEGDSYFITEIKSLKRILDKVNKIPCFCFIDEILKGTNTIERIAASAAVLKYLLDKDCLCMVASHDIELTVILNNEYDNYHFSEQINDEGIYFDYLLKHGASQTKNAIKLLHLMHFDDKLIKNAESFVEKFTSTQKW